MQRVGVSSSGHVPADKPELPVIKKDSVALAEQAPDSYDGARSAGKQTNSNFVGTSLILGTVALGAIGAFVFRRKLFTPRILKQIDADIFHQNFTPLTDSAGKVLKGQYAFKIDANRRALDAGKEISPSYVEGTLKYLGNKVEVMVGGKTRQYGAWRVPEYLMRSLKNGTLGQGPCAPTLRIPV